MKKLLIFSVLALLFFAIFSCEKDTPLTPLADDQSEMVTISKDVNLDDQSETVIFRSNAGNTVKHFDGMYTGFSIDPEGCSVQNGVAPVHFLFDGKGTHVGKSTWEACQYNKVTGFDPETGYLLLGILESYFTITAANGDKFTGTYTGEGELRGDGNVYFWGTFIVTPEGNTGRFECVTGELPFNGQTHPDGNFFYIEDGYLDFTNDDC